MNARLCRTARSSGFCRVGRWSAEFLRAEKGTVMFCNSCNNSSIWIILLIIILFGYGGFGCGCGCGCDNNCGNNGCGCGC